MVSPKHLALSRESWRPKSVVVVQGNTKSKDGCAREVENFKSQIELSVTGVSFGRGKGWAKTTASTENACLSHSSTAFHTAEKTHFRLGIWLHVGSTNELRRTTHPDIS